MLVSTISLKTTQTKTIAPNKNIGFRGLSTTEAGITSMKKDEFTSTAKTSSITKISREKLNEKLLAQGDKNDNLMSFLLYVEGGKINYSFLIPRTIEAACFEGYDVNPRFSKDERDVIIHAVTSENENSTNFLLNLKDKKVEEDLREFFEEAKKTYSFPAMAYSMKNRKELELKNEKKLPVFSKEVAPFDGYDIGEIIKNTNKQNKSFLPQIVNAKNREGYLWLKTPDIIMILKTITSLAEKEPISKNQRRFLTYILDIKNYSPSLSPSGAGISNLLKSYSPEKEDYLKKAMKQL